MKFFSITAAALLLLSNGTLAQKKFSFSSQTYVGIVSGEDYTELQIQAINGVKINKWFGGIGTGIDWYYLRSVPLFASVNRDIFQKGKKTFLLTADAGINFPWKDERYYWIDYVSDSKQSPGLYWAGGISYKFGVGKSDNAVLLNFGYSYKQAKETVTNIYPCFSPPCTPNVESFNYKLKRLSVRIGWAF